MAIYSESMINSDPDWVHNNRYIITKTEESCYICILNSHVKEILENIAKQKEEKIKLGKWQFIMEMCFSQLSRIQNPALAFISCIT